MPANWRRPYKFSLDQAAVRVHLSALRQASEDTTRLKPPFALSNWLMAPSKLILVVGQVYPQASVQVSRARKGARLGLIHDPNWIGLVYLKSLAVSECFSLLFWRDYEDLP